MPSCSSSREPAQQTCPWLNQMASTTPSTAPSMIGVVEHDERRLAAELERQRLAACPPSARGSARPTSVEPVKAILSTPAMLDQQRAGAAVAGHDVEHARRQPGLRRQLGEQQRRERA